MEPIYGFVLYFVCSLIVAIIASKRGRFGIVLFVACIIGGVAAAAFGSAISGGKSMVAGLMAFAVPAIGLLVALTAKTSEQVAVQKGEHGDFRKCPFCAESIRKEAIKCKHCGSAVTAI